MRCSRPQKNATIRIFDASFDDEDDPWDTFYLSLTLNNGHKRKVKSLAFDEEGTKLVSVSEVRGVRLPVRPSVPPPCKTRCWRVLSLIVAECACGCVMRSFPLPH